MTLEEKVYELTLILKKAAKIVEDIKLEMGDSEKNECITSEEYTALMWELEGWPDIVKAMFKNYSITSVEQLPRKELVAVRTRIKEIKKTHESYNIQ